MQRADHMPPILPTLQLNFVIHAKLGKQNSSNHYYIHSVYKQLFNLVTCREQNIAKRYSSASVRNAKKRIPNIHVKPSTGNKITNERIVALEKMQRLS
jgi:hypothetical protein